MTTESGAGGTAFAAGHLAANPLPTGILGALGIGGYQLLADVAGVGAGRLGLKRLPAGGPGSRSHPAPGGYTDLSASAASEGRGRRVGVHPAGRAPGLPAVIRLPPVLERSGMRSKINLLNPATGAVAMVIPDKHPGRLLGGTASRGCSRRPRACPRPGRRLTPRTPNCCTRSSSRWRCAMTRSAVSRRWPSPTGRSSWRNRIIRWTQRPR